MTPSFFFCANLGTPCTYNIHLVAYPIPMKCCVVAMKHKKNSLNYITTSNTPKRYCFEFVFLTNTLFRESTDIKIGNAFIAI